MIMDRMNLVNDIFENKYKSDSFDVCPIQIKRYFDYSQKDYIINEFIPQLDYGTRGFYFVPLKM